MLNKKALAATAPGVEPVYVEDVFSTYLYTGNGSIQRVNNGIALSDNGSFVVYENATNIAALSGSFAAQSGDIIVSFVLNSSNSAVTFTLNGSSKTAATTFVDGNNYWSGVFIETLSAGANTFSTGSVNNGYTHTIVIRGASSVSVGTNLATTGTNDTTTTSSFSTTGFGLLLFYDRDPSANPTISGSYTVTDYTATYIKSRFFAVSGNGSTVASQSVSGLVASYEGAYCGLKIEGLGATVPTVSGEDGLVWIKGRAATDNSVADTLRGVNKYLVTNNTDGSSDFGYQTVTAFNANGFSVGNASWINETNSKYVSWTFRKAEKFFDVVTYTGNGTAGRTVSHNLGSVPGCMIVKKTSASGNNWAVYHRSVGNTGALYLNTTAATDTWSAYWNNTTPTSTVFTVGTSGETNQNGATYVAYLFAHDAGGFGDDGDQNIISCGTFNATNPTTVTLGWEPQWVLFKDTVSAGNWFIYDSMRGMSLGVGAELYPNTVDAEGSRSTGYIAPTATGFTARFPNGGNACVYIAIRRGPMKTPESGTSVYSGLTYTGNGTSGRYISGAGFPPDLVIQTARSSSENREFDDRLRGWGSTATNALFSNSTNAESADSGSVQLLNQDGFTVRSFGNGSSVTYIGECFRRAPGFFDVVCYTGTGSNRTVTHNLGVAPELMIVKNRTAAGYNWTVYSSALGNTKHIYLDVNYAEQTGTSVWNDTSPTASVFTVGTSALTNGSNNNHVAYLFASLTGVSKVGSYTGTGTTLQVNCGFTGGARFVLIKRTDSTGDWYVWDSARGIVSGNDPYLLLNSTAAEVTNTDYIDTYSSGFEISSTAPAAINANGGTFIFLAVA